MDAGRLVDQVGIIPGARNLVIDNIFGQTPPITLDWLRNGAKLTAETEVRRRHSIAEPALAYDRLLFTCDTREHTGKVGVCCDGCRT